MNIKFKKILERDIDLLMINKFINDSRVLDFFLEKVNLNGYKIVVILCRKMSKYWNICYNYIRGV